MPMQLSQPVQTVQPVRSSNSGLKRLVVILAIVILTPLVGAGITLATLYSQGQFSHPTHAPITSSPHTQQAQATPVATPAAQSSSLPSPSSFKKTSSSDLNVALQYPSNWTLEAAQKGAEANSINIHSTQTILMAFQVIRFSPALSSQFTSADNVDQANLSQIQSSQGIHNLQVATASNSQPSIGGSTWAQEEATFTDDTGTKYHIVITSVQHNKVYYAIVAYAPDSYYNDALKKYIQPMFDSFQFLS
jgi:hypothetical protein